MKTILPALLLIFSSIKVSAQFTEPGQVVLGGNFNVYSLKDSSYNSGYLIKNAAYSASVSAGKFVKKNVLSKFSVGISGSSGKNIYSNFTTSNPAVSFNVGYSRTYYKQLVKNLCFGIGGGININYGTSKSKQSNSNTEIKTNSYGANLGLQPEFAYQLSKRLVLNLGTVDFLNLYYSHSETKNSSTPSATPRKAQTFGLSAGFWSNPLSNFSFGFSYLLKKK